MFYRTRSRGDWLGYIYMLLRVRLIMHLALFGHSALPTCIHGRLRQVPGGSLQVLATPSACWLAVGPLTAAPRIATEHYR